MAKKPARKGVFPRGEKEQPAHIYAERLARKFHLSITSGYRSKAENAAIGGAPNSYHTRGLGFDFVPQRSGAWGQLDRAKAWAYARFSRKFAEVLWRVSGHYDHLHIAIAPGKATPSRRRY